MANIIDDQLPGGPQWIENLGHAPVWVEDKTQLKKELDKRQLEPAIRSEQTPQPKPDDPRFSPHGARAMQAIVLPGHEGRRGGPVTPVPRSHMELLSNFAATWGKFDGPAFGLHCQRCGQDVVGRNGITDAVLSVACGCREYVSERRIVG